MVLNLYYFCSIVANTTCDNSYQFKCDNHRCLNDTLARCDGVISCVDGSDESGCKEVNCRSAGDKKCKYVLLVTFVLVIWPYISRLQHAWQINADFILEIQQLNDFTTQQLNDLITQRLNDLNDLTTQQLNDSTTQHRTGCILDTF